MVTDKMDEGQDDGEGGWELSAPFCSYLSKEGMDYRTKLSGLELLSVSIVDSRFHDRYGLKNLPLLELSAQPS